MKIIDKAKGNWEHIKADIAALREGMPLHWERHKRAVWMPKEGLEHKLHTGQNLITEAFRLAPYLWAHLVPVFAVLFVWAVLV